MKPTMLVAGGLAALAAIYLAGQLLAQSLGTTSQPPQQTRLAFVNIVTIFQNYQKAKIYKDEMEKLIEPYRVKAETLKQEMIKWKNDLGDPKFPKEKTDQWQQGIIKNQRDLEDLNRQVNVLIGKKNEEQVVQLYKEVQEAVQAHAVAAGFHAVMAYGENPKTDPFSFANITRKVQGMEMGGGVIPMYFAPGLDISLAVAEALNSRYRAAGGLTVPGTTTSLPKN